MLPRTCFSIEPGIYLPEFGVRSEVNVFVDGAGKVHVTGGDAADGGVGDRVTCVSQTATRKRQEETNSPQSHREDKDIDFGLLCVLCDSVVSSSLPADLNEPLAEDDHVVAVGVEVVQRRRLLVAVLEVEAPRRLVERQATTSR